LTSTFVTGSTTPTSRTLTWRSSAVTVPSRNGRLSALAAGFSFPFREAKTTPVPTRVIPTTETRIHFFFMARTPRLSSP
jgi:hypothetical protein